MAIASEDIRYVSNGTEMHGRLFRDDGWTGQRPAVLVFPEGFGISEHTFAAARRMTELGYIGVACDLYGGGYFHNGSMPRHISENERFTAEPERLLAVGTGALEHVRARDDVDGSRIAASGYCLGGTIAMALAFDVAPIVAVASFHPSFRCLPLANAAKIVCPMHLFIGSLDYAAPPEARAAFEKAMGASGAAWRLMLYGGVKHSFTNPNIEGLGDRAAYDPEADAHSWASMAALFEKTLAPG